MYQCWTGLFFKEVWIFFGSIVSLFFHFRSMSRAEKEIGLFPIADNKNSPISSYFMEDVVWARNCLWHMVYLKLCSFISKDCPLFLPAICKGWDQTGTALLAKTRPGFQFILNGKLRNMLWDCSVGLVWWARCLRKGKCLNSIPWTFIPDNNLSTN